MKKNRTKELLADSLYEIARQKSFDKITIQDIVADCGMSSSTFYRHFRDKYDLAKWIYEQKYMVFFQNQGRKDDGVIFRRSQTGPTLAWVMYCRENRVFLLNLLKNTGGEDSFLDSMIMAHARMMESLVIAGSGEQALTDTVRRRIYLYAGGGTLLMEAWLRGRIRATPEGLAEAIIEAVPAKIIPLIISRVSPGVNRDGSS